MSNTPGLPAQLPYPLPNLPNADPNAGTVIRRTLPAPIYQFFTFHSITREPLLGPINMTNPVWSKTIGANGTFVGSITIPEDDFKVSEIKVGTALKETALYIKELNSGIWVWGGPIVARNWNPTTQTLELNAVEWRSWLSWKIIGPYPAFPTPAASTPPNFSYDYSHTDQLIIAKDIVNIACRGGLSDKVPTIILGNETSGSPPPEAALRDLHFHGSDFKKASDLIDSMANRSGGFDWDLAIFTSNVDGWPQLKLQLYYPQKGSTIPGLLFFKDRKGSNIYSYGPVVESASKVVERVWATGSNSEGSNSPIYVQDTNPLIADSSNNLLMVEDTYSASSISNINTLSQHARSERVYLSSTFNTIQLSVPLNYPNKMIYNEGDRARLILKDQWLDIDISNVRITSIQISPQDVGGAGAASITLDLNDAIPPDDDLAGSI